MLLVWLTTGLFDGQSQEQEQPLGGGNSDGTWWKSPNRKGLKKKKKPDTHQVSESAPVVVENREPVTEATKEQIAALLSAVTKAAAPIAPTKAVKRKPVKTQTVAPTAEKQAQDQWAAIEREDEEILALSI